MSGPLTVLNALHSEIQFTHGAANVFGVLLLHEILGHLVGNGHAQNALVQAFKGSAHDPVLIRLRTDFGS